MARKKRRTPRRKTAAKRLQERLSATAAKAEAARLALVAELKAQRKDVERQLRAAGVKRGRRKAKR